MEVKMQREEIINELVKHDSTVLSFPNRGNEWGSSSYRGNCSGWIHAFLIWKYKVEKMAELFAGSGTGYDVAKDMNIKYVAADLNPTAVRPGILNVNALLDDVPDEFFGADLTFMHPPYGKEINIPYAGSMYKDPTGELSKYDLGQMPWKEFMRALNEIVLKYYAAMENGSRMAILMGDVKRQGKLYSMISDIAKPGQLEQILIKMQHNCVSYRNNYSNSSFVPIVHEYIMVLKKLAPYMINFTYPKEYEIDIRDSVSATWKDVVFAVCKKHGRPLSLSEIYAEVDGHSKTKGNNFWREKIRQTLQMYPMFTRVGDGVWAVAV